MSLPFPMGGSPYWLVNPILGGIDAGLCSQDQLQQAIQLQYSSSSNQKASSFTNFAVVAESPLQSLQAYDLEKQCLEMDWLLELENQELRRTVQEKTRQQIVLLQTYESRIKNLMRQKEQDLEMARNRRLELQKFLIKAEAEAQAWQKKAMENEAMVLDLNNRINQVKQSEEIQQDEESSTDPSIIRDCKFQKVACKLCNVQRQSIVFLPCRHLCSCRACESFLELCPVCESVKQGIMEVFLV